MNENNFKLHPGKPGDTLRKKNVLSHVIAGSPQSQILHESYWFCPDSWACGQICVYTRPVEPCLKQSNKSLNRQWTLYLFWAGFPTLFYGFTYVEKIEKEFSLSDDFYLF